MDLGTLGFFLQEHHFKYDYVPKLISNENNLKSSFGAKSFQK
jgi:hypothetical protein